MDLTSLIIALIGVFICCVGYFVYDQRIRLFRPSEFGIDDFQRIAKHESSSWRDNAYTNGITRREWKRVLMNQSQAITDALKRRDVDTQ